MKCIQNAWVTDVLASLVFYSILFWDCFTKKSHVVITKVEMDVNNLCTQIVYSLWHQGRNATYKSAANNCTSCYNYKLCYLIDIFITHYLIMAPNTTVYNLQEP